MADEEKKADEIDLGAVVDDLVKEAGAEIENPFSLVFGSMGKGPVEALDESSFNSLEELHQASDADIKAIKGIGARSVPVIRGLLAQAGYEQPEEPEEGLPLSELLRLPHPSTVDVTVGGLQDIAPGTVKMKINMHDRGEDEDGNTWKFFKKVGEVVWGNEDPAKDLPEDYVKNLMARGEAVGRMEIPEAEEAPKKKKGKGKKK